MTYPPPVPPATRGELTPQAAAHALDHNTIAAALADIVAELGGNPSGLATDVAARFTALEGTVGSTLTESEVSTILTDLLTNPLSAAAGAVRDAVIGDPFALMGGM